MKSIRFSFRTAAVIGLCSVSVTSVAIDSRTDGMIEMTTQRILLHKMFPNREADEALVAQAHGNLPQQDLARLLQGSSEDYFSEMDYGITLNENQSALATTLNPFFPGIKPAEAAQRAARGRNLWMVWTGGNDRFWNYLTRATFGGFDLLKVVSDYPTLVAQRGNRWKNLGLVSEPCFEKATAPRADRWGLWVDNRSAGCTADPFEDATKYPGVKTGSRGQTLIVNGQKKTLEVGSFYGYASGIVGLRLFPNPDFGQKEALKWDAKRYYEDPAYFNDPNLVRPYRVGMACAFCHVGPNPTRPPADFENPLWKNLNANVGAQYFWVDRIFVWDQKHADNNFIYQMLHTSRPGSLDTSLVSSDQINNPRTMNAVYDLAARVTAAENFDHREQLMKDETLNSQFSRLDPSGVPTTSPLRSLYDNKANTVLTPRVLKDGSDSVGALGALNRVFINIGLFSEEWMQNFLPFMGGIGSLTITPMKIQTLNNRSLYWKATVNQTPDLALFFLAATRPDKLEMAPGGSSYLKDPSDPQVQTGKKLFADNCAYCHSSKLPEKAYGFFNKGTACLGENYMTCWNEYYAYTQTQEFRDEMEKIVQQSDFLEHNYLSTELRVPANLTDGQLCSPVATNALRGNIWDNFSSDSYKRLPSIGQFTVNYPAPGGSTLAHESITVPGDGRGFLRPASLLSLWSTAPFLQNNSVGKFDERGTVAGRMVSFNDSIQKMLNPELRGQDLEPGQRVMTYTTSFGDQLPGIIDVTTATSYLKIPKGFLPSKVFSYLKQALDADPVAAQGIISKQYDFIAINSTDSAEMIAKEVIPPALAKPSPSMALITDATFPPSTAHEAATSGVAIVDRVIASTQANPAPSAPTNGMAADYPDDQMGDFIKLGPIPAGVPVNLIANMKLESPSPALSKAVMSLARAVMAVKKGKLTGSAATQAFMTETLDPLLAVDTCKDFVVNRGHYFGTQYAPENKRAGKSGMTAEEKASLIEFLKFM